MVTTVTLNPCIDFTTFVDSLLCGKLNISKNSRRDLGGKGINVSIALNNLEVENKALTFEFSKSSQVQKEFFESHNLKNNLIKTQGELRTNIKIFENSTGNMTEINEIGSEIPKETLVKLESEIINEASNSKIMIFGGSIAPGIPDDFYKTVIEKCKLKNPDLKIILDTSGLPFTEGVKAKPYLIKPNLFELESALKIKLTSKEEIISASREIINKGVELVCVSMGKDGAMIISKNQEYYKKAPKIEVKSAQGAGDSLVAGLTLGILENQSIEKILSYGISMASATITHEGTIMGTKTEFLETLATID